MSWPGSASASRKWGLPFEYACKLAQLKEAEQKASDPSLWEESTRAQEFMKELGALREELRPLQELEARLEEIEVLLELAREDPSDGEEALREAGAGLKETARLLDKLELETLFSGKYDFNNAIVSIHPGAGGWNRRIGRRCCCACIPAGPSERAGRWSWWTCSRATRPA